MKTWAVFEGFVADHLLETKEAHFLVTEVLDVLAKEVHENGK